MSLYSQGLSETVVPVKISDLKDVVLEWAAAKAIGMTDEYDFSSNFPRVRAVKWDVGGPWYLSAGWNRSHPNGLYDWEPLSDWRILGELIDRYGLTWQWTARDHEEQRVTAFCPGSYNKGQSYGPDCKTAMLRALVQSLQDGDEIEIPLDLLIGSTIFIDPTVKAQFREFDSPEVIVFEDRMYDGDF